MEFVQKFTPPDFRAKNFTPSISPNFNSFSKKKYKQMSENGEIYNAGKNFTLPLAVTALTNSISVDNIFIFIVLFFLSVTEQVEASLQEVMVLLQHHGFFSSTSLSIFVIKITSEYGKWSVTHTPSPTILIED